MMEQCDHHNAAALPSLKGEGRGASPGERAPRVPRRRRPPPTQRHPSSGDAGTKTTASFYDPFTECKFKNMRRNAHEGTP